MTPRAEPGGDPIRVYSMMICPFAQRTRLHLELLEPRPEGEELSRSRRAAQLEATAARAASVR